MKNSLLVLFIIPLIGFGQDLIINKTGEEIEADVLEIGINIIKYKKFAANEGPVYNIDKREVFMIKYSDGSKDLFNTEAPNNKNYKVPEYMERKEYHSLENLKIGSVEGNRFFDENYRALSKEDIDLMFRSDGDIYNLYRSGVRKRRGGIAMITIGAVDLLSALSWLISANVGGYASSVEFPYWMWRGIDCALIGVGVSFFKTSLEFRNKSVEMYNESIVSSKQENINLGLILDHKGIGLSVKF